MIIVFMFYIFTFIPLSYLNITRLKTENTKQCLNLSVKVLSNSILPSRTNFSELAQGFAGEDLSPLEVDKDKLMREFYDVAAKNCYSSKDFNHLKEKLLFKTIVYPDRFFIADTNDKWSVPYFFTYNKDGELLYLNTRDDTVYSYDSAGNMLTWSLTEAGISRSRKNDLIIDRINSILSGYTGEPGSDKALNIKILNPDNNDSAYKISYSYFNVLEGVTFFVVYKENRNIDVKDRDFRFKNYNVAGYTLY